MARCSRLTLGWLVVLTTAFAPAVADAAPARGLQVRTLTAGTSTAAIDRDLDHAKAVGAKIVRTELRWDLAEPRQGAFDEHYLTIVQHFVDAAASRGMRTMLTIDGTPCWASAEPSKGTCSGPATPQKVSGYQPTNGDSVAAVAGLAATRYGAKLAAIEIWNEPDHINQRYFAGPDKAAKYAAVLKAAYAAIKAADPQVQVLGGSLVGSNGRFLEALYREGIKGSYDALSVHYYDLVLGSLRSIRTVMTRNGDHAPVWLGEFGYTSCAPQHQRQGGHACVTRPVAALSIGDVFRGLRNTSWVKAAVIYSLTDFSGSDFGLLDRGGKPKPAYAAVHSLFTKAIGAPRAVRLSLRRSGGQVIASGSGPAADAYDMTVSKGGKLRFRAAFRLDRDLRFRFALPRQLGTRGLRVRVVYRWTGRSATRRI